MQNKQIKVKQKNNSDQRWRLRDLAHLGLRISDGLDVMKTKGNFSFVCPALPPFICVYYVKSFGRAVLAKVEGYKLMKLWALGNSHPQMYVCSYKLLPYYTILDTSE